MPIAGSLESGARAADEAAYPGAFARAEERLIASRRAVAGLPPVPADGTRRWSGVGLSGGGIRSATFCLGVFQGLARLKLVRHVDVLSTVSGGGYFGSFLGALYARPWVRPGQDAPNQIEEVLSGSATEGHREDGVIAHLRENGRYLSPNGSGDLLIAGAALLRNWVAMHVVLVTFALMVFLAAQLLRWWAQGRYGEPIAALLGRGEVANPWLLVPIAIFAFLALPQGWAYWMVGKHDPPHPSLGLFATLLSALGLLWWAKGGGIYDWRTQLGAPLLATAVLTAIAWATVRFTARARRGRDRDFTQRNLLTKGLAGALVTAAFFLGLAIVDRLAQSLYAAVAPPGAGLRNWIAPAFGALLAGAEAARRVAVLFSSSEQQKRPGRLTSFAATLGALLLGGAILVSIDALAHGFVWRFRVPAPGSSPDLDVAVYALAVTFIASLFFGHTAAFLNRSSHHSLYAGRLMRAYLGASNRARSGRVPLHEVVPGDDVEVGSYWGGAEAGAGAENWCGALVRTKGAPIHLVNVTVNETLVGSSQQQHLDRKGIGLALGPCGMSLGVRHHAEMSWMGPFVRAVHAPPEFSAFKLKTGPFSGDKRSLAGWTAISGAAFSTGTGYRTSLGLSLLAGLANVRLGYWWKSGGESMAKALELGMVREGVQKPWWERLSFTAFPGQSFFLSEFLARFPGTAFRRWYLSDGGHFENLGGYELLRRRLANIILVDAEADPEYLFGGLANLVRKARLDFGTEIQFLDDEALNDKVHEAVRDHFGTLDELRRGPWCEEPGLRRLPQQTRRRLEQPEETQFSRAYAALAEVRYPGAAPGTLLYIKPTLCGIEPVDLLDYHNTHSAFPQETTIDQFFDEAQWEAYRKLGEWITERLFAASPSPAAGPAPAWSPRDLLR